MFGDGPFLPGILWLPLFWAKGYDPFYSDHRHGAIKRPEWGMEGHQFYIDGVLECRDKYSCFNVFHGRETCKGK